MNYSKDPKWIKAKYYSKCCKCGKEILKGGSVFWFPLHKQVFCEDCGKPESASFEAAKFDESVMTGQW